MRLECPNCGERDSREFTYRGSAKLMARPEQGGDFHDYVYVRSNPAEVNAELWHHAYGCRAWLHVRRNVTTHEILEVVPAASLEVGDEA